MQHEAMIIMYLFPFSNLFYFLEFNSKFSFDGVFPFLEKNMSFLLIWATTHQNLEWVVPISWKDIIFMLIWAKFVVFEVSYKKILSFPFMGVFPFLENSNLSMLIWASFVVFETHWGVVPISWKISSLCWFELLLLKILSFS